MAEVTLRDGATPRKKARRPEKKGFMAGLRAKLFRKRDPAKAPIGTGIADIGRKIIKRRPRQIDDAVDRMVNGK